MVVRTFRLDVGDRSEADVKDAISSWLTKNDDILEKYVIAHEYASETGKPHFQGIVYIKEGVKWENKVVAFRLWKHHEKSFAIVKNEESYRKYIKKDGDIRYSKGITQGEMDSWGDWDTQTQTKKEKKESRRAEMYKAFLQHCREHDGFDVGYMDLRWVANRLLDFMGTQPLPEQVNWFKGMIFSAQASFLHGVEVRNGKILNARDAWVERVLY